MSLEDILKAHADLLSAKQQVSMCQVNLQSTVVNYLSSLPVRATAQTMGVSAAYVCDVRHGNRTVSDEFVARLVKLELTGGGE